MIGWIGLNISTFPCAHAKVTSKGKCAPGLALGNNTQFGLDELVKTQAKKRTLCGTLISMLGFVWFAVLNMEESLF